MECSGCFICCDDDRENFLKIKEIKVSNVENDAFNGIYVYSNMTYSTAEKSLKPAYVKKNNYNIKLKMSDNGSWMIIDTYLGPYIYQKVKCPITTWKEEHNYSNSEFANTHKMHFKMCKSFSVDEVTEAFVKPAKK